MTSNKDFKRLARRLAAEKGISYTAAVNQLRLTPPEPSSGGDAEPTRVSARSLFDDVTDDTSAKADGDEELGNENDYDPPQDEWLSSEELLRRSLSRFSDDLLGGDVADLLTRESFDMLEATGITDLTIAGISVDLTTLTADPVEVYDDDGMEICDVKVEADLTVEGYLPAEQAAAQQETGDVHIVELDPEGGPARVQMPDRRIEFSLSARVTPDVQTVDDYTVEGAALIDA